MLSSWPVASLTGPSQPPACHPLLWPLLTSAWASRHLSMSVARRFPSAPLQISPGMTHPPSRLCLSDIRHGVPYKFRASQIFACSPRRAASYPLPVRQASTLLSASFRFHHAMDTLAVQLTLPLAGCVEDLHLQVILPATTAVPTAPVTALRAMPGAPKRKWQYCLKKLL